MLFNLTIYCEDPTKNINFSKYNDAKCLFDMIKHKDTSLSNAEENQADLKSELSNIEISSKKSSAQKKVIKNVEKFYDSRGAAINFYKDYSPMVITAAYDAKQQKASGLIISKTNASKIANGSCTNKSRQQFRKFTK